MNKKVEKVEKDESIFLFWILLSIFLSALWMFVFTIIFNLVSYAFHYNLVLYIISVFIVFLGVFSMAGLQISFITRRFCKLASVCLCIFVLVLFCIAVSSLTEGGFPKALLPKNAYIEYKAYDRFMELKNKKSSQKIKQEKWAEEATIQEQIDKKFQEFMKKNKE